MEALHVITGDVQRQVLESTTPLTFTLMKGLLFLSTISKGSSLMSFCTVESLKRRPMRRFPSNSVYEGLMVAWILAA